MRIDSVRRLLLDFRKAGEKRVHVRQRRRNEHPHLLSSRAQRLGKREAAAEGVPVRILVSKDEDLLVGVDELFDLVVDVCLGVWAGYFVSSLLSSMVATSACSGAAGRTSLSSSLMWTLYSIEGSISNRRSGENFRFCRRLPSSWRIKPVAETRPAIDASFSSGLPSTLTRTRA